MGCSSSTQTQSQESSRPVTKTGVTNGLKQSAASDGNASTPYKNEICLDKKKQCAIKARVDAQDKTRPTNNLGAKETMVVMPAIDGASFTCEEGNAGETGSPDSRERDQMEYLRSTDKAKYPQASEESVPPTSAGNNETPGIDEKDNDGEIKNGTQSAGRFVEIEIFGTIKEIKPLRSDGEEETLETVEYSQHQGMAQEADPQRTAEETKHLVTSVETEPQEIVEEIQHVETERETGMLEENNHVEIAEETETSGTLEETEHEETAGETKPSGILEESECEEETVIETEPSGTLKEPEHEETSGETKPSGMIEKTELEETSGETKPSEKMEKTEHEGTAGETEPAGTVEKKALVTSEKHTLLATVEDNEFPEVLEGDQPLEATGKNRVEKTQQVETVEGNKPKIAEGTEENMKPLTEVDREIHMNEEDEAIEGETGERVETEMHSEIVSEGSETKEEETGEAVDTTAATEMELTNSKK
ncbi:glutamate-rich protein 5 [Gracilinanus agilis]|uniref:glutamate-rich protein 5 n=1 Tax=Gracilinanus agilis TaxID=191870 RepID=UPI001CFEA65B|nr:glutamate-rich protein 5 [Gracilinanus agilis]